MDPSWVALSGKRMVGCKDEECVGDGGCVGQRGFSVSALKGSRGGWLSNCRVSCYAARQGICCRYGLLSFLLQRHSVKRGRKRIGTGRCRAALLSQATG